MCVLHVVRCTLCVLREVVAVISIDSLNFAQVVMVSRNPVWSPLTAPRLGIGECVWISDSIVRQLVASLDLRPLQINSCVSPLKCMYRWAVHFHYKMDAFKGNIYLGITIEIIFKLEQAFIFLFQVAKLNFKGIAALIEICKLTLIQDQFVSLWSIQE